MIVISRSDSLCTPDWFVLSRDQWNHRVDDSLVIFLPNVKSNITELNEAERDTQDLNLVINRYIN